MPDAPVTKTIPPAADLKQQIALLTRPETNPTAYQPFANAGRFAFEPAAKAVTRVNAWWLAEAAWVSYWQSDADVKAAYKNATGMNAELINVGATNFTVATSPTCAIVAFRGTQPDQWQDIFSDARWVPKPWDAGYVHHGFAEAFEIAWPVLKGRLAALPAGCPVWITGHSLGAALATLAAVRVGGPGGVCTFGSPLVGDQIFAGTFNARFGERSLRYVNDFDIVTRVPPESFALPFGRFTHVDALRWIDRGGRIADGPVPTNFFGDVIGAANASFMLHLMRHIDTMGFPSLPDALRDHTPLHYVIQAWNDFAQNWRP